ncbi:MAG TPA: lysophospholipid acyltransferase family protein [Bacteroidales bacterium]|nr:lysophospholipid acyltransferase family protein [Bacteroidales bacterium]
MNYLIYLVFRLFVFLFRIVPFRVLYLFADFLYLIIFYVVGYRKKVVVANLLASFPGKSGEERMKIAKAFYHHLSDMLIESLKGFSMREQEMITRYRFHDTSQVNAMYRQGRSVIIVAGHYGNWEWAGIAAGNQMLHRPVGFYKPLSNPYIDRYMRNSRIQGRSTLAPITQTKETFRADYGEPAAFYMVADQSPSSPRLAYWVNFLEQDTATLHGPEKYAAMLNLPVFFAYVSRIKRGKYVVYFEPIALEPTQTTNGEITRSFMRRLEKIIIDRPDLYLWSHRRWKLHRNK